jgi:hypothetical protein
VWLWPARAHGGSQVSERYGRVVGSEHAPQVEVEKLANRHKGHEGDAGGDLIF